MEEKKSQRGYRGKARLNNRELKTLRGIAQGKNPTRAALDAGYSKAYAKNVQNQMLRKTRLQEAMADIFDRIGLTDEAIATKVKKGIDAKKQVVALSGDVVGETDDHKAQFNYVQLACKLKGKLVDKAEVVVTETHADLMRKIRERNPGRE